MLSALIATTDIIRALTSFGASRSGSGWGAVHDLIGPLGVLLYVGQLVVTGSWLLRVRRNAKELWPDGVGHTAAWAYLGWFVPFFCLFVPKQVLDQSWRITADATEDGSKAGSTSWWWSGWLLLGFVGGLDARIGGIHPRLEILVAVVSCATLLAWIRVVRGVTATQDHLVTSLTTN